MEGRKGTERTRQSRKAQRGRSEARRPDTPGKSGHSSVADGEGVEKHSKTSLREERVFQDTAVREKETAKKGREGHLNEERQMKKATREKLAESSETTGTTTSNGGTEAAGRDEGYGVTRREGQRGEEKESCERTWA
ncbi:hypothetical protein TRVL_05573 [Trypanosoma vivax]|nr:hypothetical protein TRVL_05573 [Trypanosoma vivax]